MKNHLILLLQVAVTCGVSGLPVLAQSSSPVIPPVSAATTVSVPVSPFVKAKSIVGKGVFSVFNDKGEPSPFFQVTITVEDQKRYRIDAVPLSASMVSKGPSFYFNDGIKQYEFNSLSNRYKIADAPGPGQRPMSQLASMAGLSLVLSPDKVTGSESVRSITEETLDGRKMVVFSDRETPRTTKTGVKSVAFRKTWIDAGTGLPVRSADCNETDGVVKTYLQIDYQDWQLNTMIAADRFVWAKPPTAEEETDGVLPVGTVAPDFKAITPTGKVVRLSDYKGQVVILDFWATWCGPCQRSLPHLQKVYQEVKTKGVAVLALCVWDDRAKYEEWVKNNEKSFTFQTAFDPAGRGANDIAKSLYRVSGIPTQYVIGKEGKIVAGFTGFEQGDKRLEIALQKIGVTVSLSAEKQSLKAGAR